MSRCATAGSAWCRLLVVVLVALVLAPFLWLLRLSLQDQRRDLCFPAAAFVQSDTVEITRRCGQTEFRSSFANSLS